MKIDLGSFAFGAYVSSGGNTPSWGTAFGQSKPDLKLITPGCDNIVVGMINKSIPVDKVYIPLGRGGHVCNSLEDEGILLAALFEKVYVNEVRVNSPFIMLVYREDSDSWPGRKTLKYSDSIEYRRGENDIVSNSGFESAVKDALQLADDSCWLISDIYIVDQEELHMVAGIVNPNESVTFSTAKLRKSAFIEAIRTTYEENQHFLKKYPHGYGLSILQQNDISDYVGDLSPIILYGPPGTGKTNKMQEDYIRKFNKGRKFVTTFHQSFSYEEFVEGLKPVLAGDNEQEGDIKYQVVDGIFKQACERAANMAGYASLDECINDTFENRKEKIEKAVNEHKIVLLCIDEINRGNVAAIFGDLISLIETSKRLGADHEMTALLPYSKETFGVPRNILVVGTMNTADRSIQLLDSALRRRFKFEELGPNYAIFGNSDVQKDAKAILQNMNAKIRCLLNKDNQIGHSYLMYAESYDDIYDALKNKIIPLLEEYFYNDVEKIRFVLSDPNKGNSFYVEDDEANDAYKIYAKDSFDDDTKIFYKLREDRPQDCETFLKHMIPTKEKSGDVNEQE